ncbi:MAG: universal stress protein [Micromonosporaceae bacterium]
MTGGQPRVIVGVDGSPHSAAALAWAATDAQLRATELAVITVYGRNTPRPEPGGITPAPPGAPEQACRDMQARLLRSLPADVTPLVTSRVLPGDPARVLTQAAETDDVLVVGTRGRSRLRSLLLGSVAQGCAERSPCPVVVIPAAGQLTTGQATHRPVVAGVDPSPEARAALRFAAGEATLRGVTLLPIHAVYPDYAHTHAAQAGPAGDNELLPPLDSAWAQLDTLIHSELADITVTTQPIAVCGDPEQILLSWSHSAALIAVGTRGTGRLHAALLGSVSSHLVQHSHCPVAVVPSWPGSP